MGFDPANIWQENSESTNTAIKAWGDLLPDTATFRQLRILVPDCSFKSERCLGQIMVE